MKMETVVPGEEYFFKVSDDIFVFLDRKPRFLRRSLWIAKFYYFDPDCPTLPFTIITYKNFGAAFLDLKHALD